MRLERLSQSRRPSAHKENESVSNLSHPCVKSCCLNHAGRWHMESLASVYASACLHDKRRAQRMYAMSSKGQVDESDARQATRYVTALIQNGNITYPTMAPRRTTAHASNYPPPPKVYTDDMSAHTDQGRTSLSHWVGQQKCQSELKNLF